MDHKEQHHEHHKKEREEKIREKRLYDKAQEKRMLPFHPGWLFVIGAGLVAAALAIWTFFLQ
jgi:hypothetical protein